MRTSVIRSLLLGAACLSAVSFDSTTLAWGNEPIRARSHTECGWLLAEAPPSQVSVGTEEQAWLASLETRERLYLGDLPARLEAIAAEPLTWRSCLADDDETFARSVLGRPVVYPHPDPNPYAWGDSPRAGKIVAVHERRSNASPKSYVLTVRRPKRAPGPATYEEVLFDPFRDPAIFLLPPFVPTSADIRLTDAERATLSRFPKITQHFTAPGSLRIRHQPLHSLPSELHEWLNPLEYQLFAEGWSAALPATAYRSLATLGGFLTGKLVVIRSTDRFHLAIGSSPLGWRLATWAGKVLEGRAVRGAHGRIVVYLRLLDAQGRIHFLHGIPSDAIHVDAAYSELLSFAESKTLRVLASTFATEILEDEVDLRLPVSSRIAEMRQLLDRRTIRHDLLEGEITPQSLIGSLIAAVELPPRDAFVDLSWIRTVGGRVLAAHPVADGTTALTLLTLFGVQEVIVHPRTHESASPGQAWEKRWPIVVIAR